MKRTALFVAYLAVLFVALLGLEMTFGFSPAAGQEPEVVRSITYETISMDSIRVRVS